MWPFVERRRHRRYPVDWEATLYCAFPGREESVPVKVIEASASGARLLVAQLQFGPYHLLADEVEAPFELMIHVPQTPVTAGLSIVWYNWSDDARQFAVGIEFAGMTEENRRTWKLVLKDAAAAKGNG